MSAFFSLKPHTCGLIFPLDILFVLKPVGCMSLCLQVISQAWLLILVWKDSRVRVPGSSLSCHQGSSISRSPVSGHKLACSPSANEPSDSISYIDKAEVWVIREQLEVEVTTLTFALNDSADWTVCRTGHWALQCRMRHIVSHVTLPGINDSMGTWGTWQPRKHLFKDPLCSCEGIKTWTAAGIF